jgi:hypothetical protein
VPEEWVQVTKKSKPLLRGDTKPAIVVAEVANRNHALSTQDKCQGMT